MGTGAGIVLHLELVDGNVYSSSTVPYQSRVVQHILALRGCVDTNAVMRQQFRPLEEEPIAVALRSSGHELSGMDQPLVGTKAALRQH